MKIGRKSGQDVQPKGEGRYLLQANGEAACCGPLPLSRGAGKARTLQVVSWHGVNATERHALYDERSDCSCVIRHEIAATTTPV